VSEADGVFPHRLSRTFSDCSARRPAGNRAALPAALILIAGILSSAGCGHSHATLVVNAPPRVVAGSPFSATVTAMYNGSRDTIIDAQALDSNDV